MNLEILKQFFTTIATGTQSEANFKRNLPILSAYLGKDQ